MITFNYYLHYSYFFRYKEFRKQIKSLVELNDTITAKSLIDAVILEHDNYILLNNIETSGDNFTSVDNLSLHHARDHLNFIEQQNQKDAVTKALVEEF